MLRVSPRRDPCHAKHDEKLQDRTRIACSDARRLPGFSGSGEVRDIAIREELSAPATTPGFPRFSCDAVQISQLKSLNIQTLLKLFSCRTGYCGIRAHSHRRQEHTLHDQAVITLGHLNFSFPTLDHALATRWSRGRRDMTW